MPRSGEQARLRLRAAALDLYERDGFEATTTAVIAAAAGVTERTFFRHFADKREVLFDGEEELRTTMAAAVRSAPPGLDAMTLVRHAYLAAVPLVVAGRSEAERRVRVMASSPALKERAGTKTAVLADALVEALVVRDVPGPTARLAARLGAAVFERAHGAWDGSSSAGLQQLYAEAEAEAVGLLGQGANGG